MTEALTLNDGSLELYRNQSCVLGQQLADFLNENNLPFEDREEFTYYGKDHTSPSVCWLWDDAEFWVEKGEFTEMKSEITRLLTLED
jgi:hypothetical protein